MSDKKYEDIVETCARTRADLDTVLHPIFGGLKKAFKIIFGPLGYTGSDFKQLSDLVYYQGGYPNPDSLPREVVLADQVSKALKLEQMLNRDRLVKLLAERGITVDVVEEPGVSLGFEEGLSDKDAKDLRSAWEGGGVEQSIPDTRAQALTFLVDRAQSVQSKICQQADTIKVEAAEYVEENFKIKKPNFIKAVVLGAVKIRRGEGKMAEKLEELEDNYANFEQAVEPLKEVETIWVRA